VHGDETPVPVRAPQKCRKGRLWTYVRDDRPYAGHAPPAAVFFYSRDRPANSRSTAGQGQSQRPAVGASHRSARTRSRKLIDSIFDIEREVNTLLDLPGWGAPLS